MTNPRITVDRTVPVSREDYDRMADQRDEFRKLAYALKSALADAQRALEEAARIAAGVPRPEVVWDEQAFDQEDWFELTQSLDAAAHSARRTLEASPKLTG